MRKIPLLTVLAAFFFLIGLGLAAADDEAKLKAAMEAFNKGDFKSAVASWKALAKNGNAEAQFSLGFMHAVGQGVEADHKIAYKWFSLAAANGHPEAEEQKKAMEKAMTPEEIKKAQEELAAQKNP